MTEVSKFMKILVLGFAVLLVAVAVLGTIEAAEEYKHRFWHPVNGEVGHIIICYDSPEYDEFVSESDVIAVATISEKTGLWWTEDGKKPPRNLLYDSWICTVYDLENAVVLKGNPSAFSAFSVCVPGGTVNGYTLDAGKLQTFEVGDEVLLFLNMDYNTDSTPFGSYSVGDPNVFIKTENGMYFNEYYGEIEIENLKSDVGWPNSVTASSDLIVYYD